MKRIRNKKVMLALGIVVVGTVGVSGSFYAQNIKSNETTYYYKGKNVLDEDILILSNIPSKEKTLEMLNDEVEEVDDGQAYTATFDMANGALGTVESDYDGNTTCYIGEGEEREEAECSDKEFEEQIEDTEEMDQKEEVKEITDISAKVDGDGNQTCYIGDEEADCNSSEFDYDEEDTMVVGVIENSNLCNVENSESKKEENQVTTATVE